MEDFVPGLVKRKKKTVSATSTVDEDPPFFGTSAGPVPNEKLESNPDTHLDNEPNTPPGGEDKLINSHPPATGGDESSDDLDMSKGLLLGGSLLFALMCVSKFVR